VISARLLVAPLLAVLLAASTALPASSASAAPARADRGKKYASEFKAAPNFPESTMKLKVKGNPRVPSGVSINVRGYIRVEDPDGYFLHIYAAPRQILSSCPISYDNTRQIFINNADVMADLGSWNLSGGSWSLPVLYRAGTAKKVIYCAYVEWIVDDVVVGGLKHDFAKAPRKRK
jgi:hypothetical protein